MLCEAFNKLNCSYGSCFMLSLLVPWYRKSSKINQFRLQSVTSSGEMTGKNILLLIPNLGTGGAQKVFRQQLSFLSSHYVVHACVFNLDGAFDGDKNTNLHSLDVPAGSNTFWKAWYFCLRVIRLRSLKKKLNIHVSISHLEGADYVNVLSRTRDKVICWIHGTKKFDENIEGKTGWLRKSVLIPFLTNRSDRIVTVSEAIRHELIDEYEIEPQKIVRIYNGFDTEQIAYAKQERIPEKFLFLGRTSAIITHCRLSRQKNLFALLQIHARVCARTKYPLIILGDGELRDELLAFSQSLNLKTFHVWSEMSVEPGYDVYFLGYQANPYRFLAIASMYVMTSGWEGFPLALCEALTCGLTGMSTDCPTGPREILHPSMDIKADPVEEMFHGDYGLLMPLANAEDHGVIGYWGQCVADVMSDPELRTKYAAAGPERVRQFELTNTMAEVVQLIENLIPRSIM